MHKIDQNRSDSWKRESTGRGSGPPLKKTSQHKTTQDNTEQHTKQPKQISIKHRNNTQQKPDPRSVDPRLQLSE